MSRTAKRHRRDADSRALESFVDAPNDDGIGEQDDECKNGEAGCPGPEADLVDELSCWECFQEIPVERLDEAAVRRDA